MKMKIKKVKNESTITSLGDIEEQKNTLEKIENILLNGGDELEVDDEIAKKALIPLERMLELAGD